MSNEELKRIAHELRTYNPAADEYKGEHIHKVWAREIEAVMASDAAQAPIIAWVRADDPTDAVSDAKKRGMIENAGAPGKKLAECYSVPAFAAPVAPQAAGDAAQAAAVPVELSGVKEALENGDGFWRTCSGCHETEDGYDVGHYPFSDVLNCTLGGGCSECGGIGAVWDNTDYADMAEFCERWTASAEQFEEWWHEGAHKFRNVGEKKDLQLTQEMAKTIWDAARAAPVPPAAAAPINLHQVAAMEAAICNGQNSEALRLLLQVRNALAAPTPTVAAAAAAPINLEGLRKKLLTPRNILRDECGWLTHPDYPICDEGTRADKFLEAFGIETRFRSMENDLPDLHERWCDDGLDDCSEWTPTPPEGEGWLLLEIYDTEDGPYALFGRDKYEAENALKRMRTRELSERIRQRQADKGAAQ